MVFPWVEKYLEQLHSSQKKLLDNTYQWMIKDNIPKAATNIKTFDSSIAIYIDDLIEDLDDRKYNIFFAGNYKNYWSEESVQKLKDFMNNGGNVIFASADDYKSGGQRGPMRKWVFKNIVSIIFLISIQQF